MDLDDLLMRFRQYSIGAADSHHRQQRESLADCRDRRPAHRRASPWARKLTMLMASTTAMSGQCRRPIAAKVVATTARLRQESLRRRSILRPFPVTSPAAAIAMPPIPALTLASPAQRS